jgi:hypothetical protein
MKTHKQSDESKNSAKQARTKSGIRSDPDLKLTQSVFALRAPLGHTAAKPLAHETLRYLQRRYGNAYVRWLLREYSLVKSDVRATKIPPSIEEEEEKTVETREMRNHPTTQETNDPDLVLGSSTDACEREAEEISAHIAAASGSFQSASGEAGLPNLLRHVAPQADIAELMGSNGAEKSGAQQPNTKAAAIGRISRLNTSAGPGEFPVPSDAAMDLRKSRGEGKRLPGVLRRKLEMQMGYDFSQVRVKDDSHAHDLCQRLSARAITMGRDVWLGRGESVHDVKLMAHEMTHVIQQSAATPLSPRNVIERVDPNRDMLKRFQDVIWQKNSSVTSYRRKLLEFQRRVPTETVDLVQSKLLNPSAAPEVHQRDGTKRLRALYGGGNAAPRQFPTINEAARDPRVAAARNADWAAGLADYGERFAWITWDSNNNTFNVAGRATGTWQGVTPGPKPADSGTRYHAGEYHQHPPLPPHLRPQTHSFPVGPSGDDRAAANADNSPGIVRDFTNTSRTTVRDYTYGPTRRSGRP